MPRAGLLGSLTSIALVIISFLPLIDVASQPIAGLAALAIILATLTARWELPRRIPGALAALVVGSLVYYVLHLAGLGPGLGAASELPRSGLRAALPLPFEPFLTWLSTSWHEAVNYLPVALPLALATVVGGTLKLLTMPPSATGSDATLKDIRICPSAMVIIGTQEACEEACDEACDAACEEACEETCASEPGLDAGAAG